VRLDRDLARIAGVVDLGDGLVVADLDADDLGGRHRLGKGLGDRPGVRLELV